MISTNDNKCSGCGACKNICPVKAIRMIVNEEGFLYPHIDTSICINCGKCSSVCQIEKNNIIKMKRIFYAAFATNPQERAKSATGGVCASIAKYIIQAGGYFCGAAFYHGKLKHMLTNDFNFFDKYMRGSKYFQSDMDDIYIEIKEKLENDKLIAFVGTPCQVNGIKLFLNKEYENLYLIDIICHGVPSSKVFEKFASSNNLTDIFKKDVSINFRDKKTGWHSSSLVIKNNDNIIYDKKIHEDPFCKAFLKDICLRKSCYMCNYTNINRVSDVMVGDFWGCPENLDDNKGLNLISVNRHGKKLLQKINTSEKNILLKKFPKNKVLQPQLCFPTSKHYARSRFFEDLEKQDFNELVNSIFNKNKNVAILNFHWENNNYGAVLTAYALNKYINSLGFYAYNIDFVPTWGKSSVSTSNFKEFKEKHLPCTKHCNNLSDLKTLNDDFGTFIVGSDQVFNPEFVNNDKQTYYLGFVNDLNKKISYSASFGQKEFKTSENDIIEVGSLLSRFNKIGVREESGVEICKNTFRTKAFHVLDPVFLLKVSEWKKLANINVACDNIYYIVNAELDKEAETCLKNFKNIRYNLNIEDWLGTLLNAKFVVTDSFHALCFCLIFNKQFVYVGKNNGRQERIRSLFKMFDLPLTSFLLDKKLDEQTILSSTQIDYTNWNKKLKPWIDLSEQFLTDALNDENTKIYDPYYFLLKKIFTEMNQREKNKLKLRYFKYKILSKITIGKKRKKCKQKYKSIKSKLKEA